MPRPSLKTPYLIERMLALHAAGASGREIAEQLGTTHATANQWLRDAGLRPNGGYGRRVTRDRVEPDGVAGALVAAQQSLAELQSTALISGSEDAMQRAMDRLALIEKLIDREGGELNAGKGKINIFKELIAIENMLGTRIEQLRPRERGNPADDPGNIEAATEVRNKLTSLVEAAERDFRCGCCGGDPHGRNGGGK